MDLSILLLVALGVAVWLERTERKAAEAEAEQLRAEQALEEALPPKEVRFLDIPGANHFGVAATGFLKRFGLPQRSLEDACSVAGPLASPEALPAGLRNALLALYEKGNVRGPDVTGFIHGSRAIGSNESLYFVLYEPGMVDSDVVAFVDVAR